MPTDNLHKPPWRLRKKPEKRLPRYLWYLFRCDLTPDDEQAQVEWLAKTGKTLIQMTIGLAIVGYIFYEITLGGKMDNLVGADFNPLRIVGVGLLLSTAIELAYTLFTPQLDEALDPVITGVAALLLLRAPVHTDLEHPLKYTEIVELGVYALIIAILFWTRNVSRQRDQKLNGKQSQKESQPDS